MKKILFFALILLFSLFFLPKNVSAACPAGYFESSVTGQCVAETAKNSGNSATPTDVSCKDNNQFKSYVNPGTCLDSYDKWLLEVWGWAMRIMIPLSVLILTGAGVIYMTSEGDSNRIGIAKKMIIGVLSGVGLLVLGRVLLVLILGDTGANLWIF